MFNEIHILWQRWIYLVCLSVKKSDFTQIPELSKVTVKNLCSFFNAFVNALIRQSYSKLMVTVVDTTKIRPRRRK